MKKIMIFIIILGSIGLNTFGAQPPARTKRTPTATAQAQQGVVAKPQAAPPVSTAVQTASARKKRISPGAGVASGRTNVPVNAPSLNISRLVWRELTDDQKQKLNELRPDFEAAVAVLSSTTEEYDEWVEEVVKLAEGIIDISPNLKNYCINVISKNLDATAEDRGIDATEEKDSISDQLRKYSLFVESRAKKGKLVGGTVREQLDWLLQNIEFGKNKLLKQEWANKVVDKAKMLVSKNEITLGQLRSLLTDAFEKFLKAVSLSDEQTEKINAIVTKVGLIIQEEKLAMQPENVKSTYYNLLMQVGDTGNWYGKTPTKNWDDSIVMAARNMLKAFPTITVNDIEKEIGSQVFFIAIMNNGQQRLAPADEVNLINVITNIKNRIAME